MLHKFRIKGLIVGISLILSLPLSAQDLQTALKLTLSEQFETAGKTLKGIRSVWIQDQSAVVKDGKVAEFRVNCKITFEVFD